MSQTDRIPPTYVNRETVVDRTGSSNTTAIIMAIVVAVLVLAGVFYFANRGAENSVAPASTTVITPAPAPALPAPSTDVTPPAPTNMAPAPTDTAPAPAAPAPTDTAPAPAPAQ